MYLHDAPELGASTLGTFTLALAVLCEAMLSSCPPSGSVDIDIDEAPSTEEAPSTSSSVVDIDEADVSLLQVSVRTIPANNLLSCRSLLLCPLLPSETHKQSPNAAAPAATHTPQGIRTPKPES